MGKQSMKLPIFDSSNGRTIIGHADGIRQATATIRRTVTVPAGFTIRVWQRTDIMQDCLGLPAGYVYAIGR
jgi:hypothetical protein